MIQNAMHEQASGGVQVLKAITQLNEITEIINSGSGAMLVGSHAVSGEMAKLTDTTREINANVDQMLSGTDQIAAAVNASREITRANNYGIYTLDQLTNSFQV